jgi:hypothetical protein
MIWQQRRLVDGKRLLVQLLGLGEATLPW